LFILNISKMFLQFFLQNMPSSLASSAHKFWHLLHTFLQTLKFGWEDIWRKVVHITITTPEQQPIPAGSTARSLC
jgi:hypothetical protein